MKLLFLKLFLLVFHFLVLLEFSKTFSFFKEKAQSSRSNKTFERRLFFRKQKLKILKTLKSFMPNIWGEQNPI